MSPSDSPWWSPTARHYISSSVTSIIDPKRLVLSKWLLAWVNVVLVVNLADKRALGTASTDFHVAPATGRIQDGLGRERLFHGLNVVVKGAPWHPRVGAFDAQYSFTDADIELLKAWGMNVVRLGIMWPGVEPGRGSVNSTYLKVMRSIVGKLHSAGIYTLLEFHQDLYASQFCGEGLPSWILDDYDLSRPLVRVHQKRNRSSPSFPLDENASHDHSDGEKNLTTFPGHSGGTSSSSRMLFRDQPRITYRDQGSTDVMQSTKMRYPASFPEPLGRRWPWPSEWEEGWEPPVELCNKHSWWLFYLSYAVSQAFQDLYDNKWGWGDLLARYWTVVAGTFKDQPGVLGYELMNEPWPGDVFSNPLLFLPGIADKRNLAPFYEKLQGAVRSVDRERILFFETITFDNFRCGWSTVPGGAEWQNKTVLSYHYYTPPNFSAKQAFAERSRESKRLGCGSMLTEFFVSTEQDRRDQADFRKARKSMLRNAFGRQVFDQKPQADKIARKTLLRNAFGRRVLDQKPKADENALLCASDGEGSSDVACEQKLPRLFEEDVAILSELPVVVREEIIEAEKGLSVVKGEERLEANKVSNWSLEEFDSLTTDVKTSVKKIHTQTHRQPNFGLVDTDDERAKETRLETDLEIGQAKPLASIEKMQQQRRARELDSVDGVLSAADVHVQSWIGWEYKAFFHKTGSIAKQSLFNEDGELDEVLAKKLARTYPQSVCGNIVSFSFDPPSSVFTFSYIAGRDCMIGRQLALTEIFVQREFYYPNGLVVEVNPPCASFTETDMMVQIRHTGGCFGYVIDVRMSRIDLVS